MLNRAKGMPWILLKRSTAKKPTFQKIDIVVVRKGRQYFIRDKIECPLAVQQVYANERFVELAEILS